MSRRTTVRDVAVGLVVIAALVSLLGLMPGQRRPRFPGAAEDH